MFEKFLKVLNPEKIKIILDDKIGTKQYAHFFKNDKRIDIYFSSDIKLKNIKEDRDLYKKYFEIEENELLKFKEYTELKI